MTSVLLRKHDGEHPRGFARISRVFGPCDQVVVVVVDLPEERLARELEAPEVVLAMLTSSPRQSGERTISCDHGAFCTSAKKDVTWCQLANIPQAPGETMRPQHDFNRNRSPPNQEQGTSVPSRRK